MAQAQALSNKTNCANFAVSPSNSSTPLNLQLTSDSKLFSEYKILRQLEILTETVLSHQQMIVDITNQLNVQRNLQEKFVYTRKEVKEIFDVTYQTLNNWDKANILPASKIGDKVFYTADVLKEALKPKID